MNDSFYDIEYMTNGSFNMMVNNNDETNFHHHNSDFALKIQAFIESRYFRLIIGILWPSLVVFGIIG